MEKYPMKQINLKSFLVTAMLSLALSITPTIWAASPVEVEIVALDHWPIRRALEQTLEMLKKFGDKVTLQQIDADTKAGKARLKASGMKGHIPVVIFVDGEFKHSLEGQEVIFENFPVASDSPMRLDGKWSAGDVKAVIEEILGAN
jgi:hypothetical protein